MPQIASTNNKKSAPGDAETSAREANLASASTEKARDRAPDVVGMAVSMAEKSADHAISAMEQKARQMPRLAASLPGPVTELAGFWQNLIKGQIEHNLDAFRKLTAARDWQERLNIQNNYIAGNLTRMSEAASRCMQFNGAMSAKMPTSRDGKTDSAR